MTFPTVLRRELRSLIASPQTYFIAAGYFIISGIFFVNLLVTTQVPDLQRYYNNVATTLVVLVPIIAMRSFAEERKAGSLNLTLSWPLSRAGIVLGKFAANTIFTWALISVVWLYTRILASLASVEVSRAAGGYIGMLLLAMAFGALALMISARSPSPTGAAFGGFALLLVLWILEFAPGWIGSALRSVAPSVRFESFPRGVLFLQDVTYFLMVTAVGVTLAIQALTRSRPGRTLHSLVRRGVMLAVAAVLVTGTPALAKQAEGEIDLTAAHRNTIAQATRDVLRRVHSPIRLTAFVQSISPEAVEVRDVVKRYRSAGATDISAETIDPDLQPGRAREAGITEYNKYIVEIDGRREVIDNLNEIPLTTAISKLARAKPPRSCFTIGHGERQLTEIVSEGLSTLAEHLRRAAYDVRPLALAGIGGKQELDGCSAVVIAGARVPFLPGELGILSDYLRNDGRLVVLADAVDGAGAVRDQLNDLLRPWGVGLGSGIVHDVSSIADDPGSVVSFRYPTKNPIVAALDDDHVPVVMTNPLPIEKHPVSDDRGDQGDTVELVRSGSRSWVPGTDKDREQKGPFVVAAAVDATAIKPSGQTSLQSRTRIGVVGSADMATNRFLDLVGNRRLLTGLVQWVSEEKDIITAYRDPVGFYKLVLTRHQREQVVRRAIVYPVFSVLVPLPVAFLRLKRG